MRWFISLLFCCAILLFAASVVLEPPIADIELRAVARHVHPGRLLRSHPLGQRFRCPSDGLHRIRVLAAPLGTPQELDSIPLELTLRAADGELDPLRRVALDAANRLRGGPRFLEFDFEPIEDSGGREFSFEITPASDAFAAHATLWLNYRGSAQPIRDWIGEPVEGDRLRGRFRAHDPDLSAIAIAFERLDTRTAPATLRLREVGDSDWLREARVPAPGVSGGFALFQFEPLVDSRFREYELELELPPGMRPPVPESGLTLVGLHGGSTERPGLLGAYRGEEALDRFDLVFGAFATGGPGAWVRGPGRIGFGLGLGLMLALSAAVLLGAHALGTRERDRVERPVDSVP